MSGNTSRYSILMHAGERDDFKDSKYISLQCRMVEQFDSQVFYRVSFSGGFGLQQVCDKKLVKT